MSYVDVGRQLLLTLEAGGAGTPFDEANSYIGVGDSAAETTDAMDDLQGTSKEYFPMDAGYPQLVGNEMVYQASIAAGLVTFSRQETALFNGNNPPTAVMHSRRIEDMGEEAGDWVLIYRVKIP